ncbi:MAG: glucosamine-6-phosphate deaminase [Ignavibacteriae bacterium HGW-Ignavibacteriae-3]|nr:MAG: glucosamine-6-phosphate deaminase [Ignavibacteriae bacterium HGW-Ignavibacteriae-3]
MSHFSLSNVEQYFLNLSGKKLIYEPVEKIPVIQVSNFTLLGKITALRFLEWVQKNPDGVVSLPTGKTPESFIKEVVYYLKNWDKDEVINEFKKIGIDHSIRPDLTSLRFVQIDEFYPIDSFQHNSFYHYIQRFYFLKFDLDYRKSLLINVNGIGTADDLPLDQIFPDKKVDLSLRTRFPGTKLERLQKRTIEIVDEFCTDYEKKIRAMGGIGFFLGGIGPDGHIGFNIQGSDHFSTTRLIETNYETQAASSVDLGGMEIARNRLVITIGLNTITYKEDATAIITAAGESKSSIVRDSIENSSTNLYPATVLQKLKAARFYITNGAALRLSERRFAEMENDQVLSQSSIERAVINLAVSKQKEMTDLTTEDYKSDRLCGLILNRIPKRAEELNRIVSNSVLERFSGGIRNLENENILHTGPHHDDIMLGYMPYIVHLVRDASIKHHFSILTSGFTAVTNSFMYEIMNNLKNHIVTNDFKNRFGTNYFNADFPTGKIRDVNLYLDGIAARNTALTSEAAARRSLRNLIECYNEFDLDELREITDELMIYFKTQYPGKKDIIHVQKLKGMLREWEEEILWAHFGFSPNSITHHRLGFYQGEIFTENPEIERDVMPILNLFRKFKPTILTVALDPEGSGPDTHYKALQIITEALRLYEKEEDLSKLKIWGYRNVWHRFHPSEANIYVPVSLNSFSLIENTFMNSYNSQSTASFPSWEYDGPFFKLAQIIQTEQYQTIRLCLGRDFFLMHDVPRVRAAHGMVFLKEMNLDEFYTKSIELKKLTENL